MALYANEIRVTRDGEVVILSFSKYIGSDPTSGCSVGQIAVPLAVYEETFGALSEPVAG